jgi:hypothetical protein
MQSPAAQPKNAEDRFRAAFERLKNGVPEVLKPGTPVSQNNVAKEADCDPSALRKARYPELINEIQAFVDTHKVDPKNSERREILRKRNKNRTVRQAKADSDLQRNALASQLVCANAMILQLTRKLSDAEAKLRVLQPVADHFSFPGRP